MQDRLRAQLGHSKLRGGNSDRTDGLRPALGRPEENTQPGGSGFVWIRGALYRDRPRFSANELARRNARSGKQIRPAFGDDLSRHPCAVRGIGRLKEGIDLAVQVHHLFPGRPGQGRGGYNDQDESHFSDFDDDSFGRRGGTEKLPTRSRSVSGFSLFMLLSFDFRYGIAVP